MSRNLFDNHEVRNPNPMEALNMIEEQKNGTEKKKAGRPRKNDVNAYKHSVVVPGDVQEMIEEYTKLCEEKLSTKITVNSLFVEGIKQILEEKINKLRNF